MTEKRMLKCIEIAGSKVVVENIIKKDANIIGFMKWESKYPFSFISTSSHENQP
jgi:hypothetical protein